MIKRIFKSNQDIDEQCIRIDGVSGGNKKMAWKRYYERLVNSEFA